MKNWKDLLDEQAPEGHAKNVMSAAADALAENRRQSRRHWWIRIAGPAFVGVAGLLAWSVFKGDQDSHLAQFYNEADGVIEEPEDLEFIAELELLEELEEIEDGSES